MKEQCSQEDKQKIDALQLEVANYKAMVKQISQGQDPIKVLVEGMGIMVDLHQQIAQAQQQLTAMTAERDLLRRACDEYEKHNGQRRKGNRKGNMGFSEILIVLKACDDTIEKRG